MAPQVAGAPNLVEVDLDTPGLWVVNYVNPDSGLNTPATLFTVSDT